MSKVKVKILSHILVFVMVISLFSMNPAAVYAAGETSGNCGANGDNVVWKYDTNTGVLTISGTGAMADYNQYGTPWYQYNATITRVNIEFGVTRIGGQTFASCGSVGEVTIPDSVETIGYSAFFATKLNNVIIPASVTNIEHYAFSACMELRNITFQGTTAPNNGYGMFYYTSQPITINYPDKSTGYSTWISTIKDGSTSPLTTSTVENGAPVLNAGVVSRSSDMYATIRFFADEAVTYYYQVDGTTPTAASLVSSGSNAGNMSSGENPINLTNLTAGSHTLYIAAKDSNSNVSNLLTVSIPYSDTTAPNPGNSGTITADDVDLTSLTLNWTKASDNYSNQATLRYYVYQSANSNIDSAVNCATYGTLLNAGGTANIDTFSVSGLSASTTYYFNIVVEDEANNKDSYTMINSTTYSDTTAPNPGNSGTITADAVASTSLTLNWIKADDNYSSQDSLKYYIYQSESNNIDTAENCVTNGTLLNTGGTADIESFDVSGLSADTTYYFNLVVEDQAGNTSVYEMIQKATLVPPNNPPIIKNDGNSQYGIATPAAISGNPSAVYRIGSKMQTAIS